MRERRERERREPRSRRTSERVGRPTYRAILKPACITGSRPRFPSLSILLHVSETCGFLSPFPSPSLALQRSFGCCECCSLRRPTQWTRV
ncbi:hypothetical protein X777_03981 [Ooceraea biroi]|uniref:Uncharacterized protein n=1 Tax=Ooceraea biroi TaxID=2015173 RepID=A0A026WJF1_OOCBI|nr:hypothetical protein X777_03981 [Ooceraea biroi]